MVACSAVRVPGKSENPAGLQRVKKGSQWHSHVQLRLLHLYVALFFFYSATALRNSLSKHPQRAHCYEDLQCSPNFQAPANSSANTDNGLLSLLKETTKTTSTVLRGSLPDGRPFLFSCITVYAQLSRRVHVYIIIGMLCSVTF